MPFEIIEGMTLADIAFVARGRDLQELFISAAAAVMSIMLHDPGSVRTTENIRFELDHEALDLLYYDFLQEFLFYKDAPGLLVVPSRVQITESDGRWYCTCEAAGEQIDRGRHEFVTDVKAVTLHGLEVVRDGDEWMARTVVDV